MRAYRKLPIVAGMVTVPVAAYKAVDSHDISFKQHHGGDGGCGGGGHSRGGQGRQ